MRTNKIMYALALFGALLSCGVASRAQDSAFFKREVKIGTETYGYRVYVPKNRDPKKKLPVMMFLHGNGANGTDN